ncbi:hypothetical protein Tcan_11645 [Toxocara canis]|uniref:Uncharacterized protein n=1 Tax=Toxocara canis TaxID=6265 RepID=A0A0B2VND6_TOXCA|nr:hypothetical protein Tcan_11645 [Toxocara canis]
MSSGCQTLMVDVTTANEVCTYDADPLRTYTDSSGTLYYDSIKSIDEASLDAAKIDGRYVKSNSSETLIKAPHEITTNGLKPNVQLIDASEVTRRIRVSEQSSNDIRQPTHSIVTYGQSEIELTKNLIYDTVDQYFESPRDDIELTLRISRNGLLPQLHVELQPSMDLVASIDRNRNASLSSDFRAASSSSLNASRNLSTDSDTSTAHPPRNDHSAGTFSYLRAIVKRIVPRRQRGKTTT